MNKNEIFNAIKNGENTDAVLNKLSESERNTLNSILKDKSATEKLLNSPQARALYNALFGGNKK